MQRDTRATTRLYLITPPALDPDRFAAELEKALAGGDVASLQLRLKDCDDDAVRVVLETKRGSVSLLQRRLTIGYSRASRLIEMMAQSGISLVTVALVVARAVNIFS